MKFILTLAWREARGSRRRGLLIVAAIAIGVAAQVAINSFTANLRESVQREARALLGADLSVGAAGPWSEKAESLVAEVRSATRPAAELARVVSFGAMAYRLGGDTTRLAQVLAVDPGYPYYGTIVTEPRDEWTRLTQTGGAIADPSLLAMLGAGVGDSIALGEARFVVRATIVDAPGDVSLRSAIGPRVYIPRSRAAETGLLTIGSRARYEGYLKLPAGADAESLAKRFRPALSSERLAVRTVAEDQRRLTETLTRFGNFLGLLALVALLLGGLGVASAVHVFIKRRMETIAVLRCLGAGSRTILAAYLVQALVVGLAGSLVGAALGAAVQLALPRLMRGLLPVDVAWSLSWPDVLVGACVGVWVALVFSLVPLLGVRRVSPLAVLRRDFGDAPRRRDGARVAAFALLGASLLAMAVLQAGRLAHGVAFAAGAGIAIAALWLAALLLVRGLRRFFPRRLPYVYRQGLANLYRPANQTHLVVLALGFGVFLLGTLVLVQHNLLRELRVDRGTARPNLVFFDVQPDQQDDVRARVTDAGPLTAPVVPIVPMRIQSLKGRSAAELLAIEDETKRPERWALRREYRSSYRDQKAASERIVQGAWWRPGEWKARRDAAFPIAVDASLARELKLGLGDEVVWDVQGVGSGDARRLRPRGGVGALRAQLLRGVPRGAARRRPEELRAAGPRRRRRAARAAAARRGRGAPERLDARPRPGPARDRGRPRQGGARDPLHGAVQPRRRSGGAGGCRRGEPLPARPRGRALAHARRAPAAARAHPARGVRRARRAVGARRAAARDRGRLGARALRVRRVVRAAGRRAARARGVRAAADRGRRPCRQHGGVAPPAARGAARGVSPASLYALTS